jgi:hypothetical protein
MRYLLVLLLLAGCTHDITLFPRGGGDQGIGWVNDGPTHSMEITLRGDKYAGNYILGQTTGIGFGSAYSGSRSAFGTSAMVGHSNQAGVLLSGPHGVLRCDFLITVVQGGNGVCLDAQGVTYDMLIK